MTSAPIAIPGSPKVTHTNQQKANVGNADPENFPPNSRLFILCDKNAQEEDIVEHFSVYGNIEYCKLIKDKATNQSKGFCYVKFEKASSAAMAIEKSEGSRIGNFEFPIKVQIAAAKGKKKATPVLFSTEPEDTPPRSRLFVVCPKELTENEIHAAFSEFEDYDYSKVILDKQTGVSKGFAYVKFKKASSAAIALEIINEKGVISGKQVKVLVADPKSKAKVIEPPQNHPEALSFFSASTSPPSPYYNYIPVPYPYLRTPVNVECDPSLSHVDIVQLFSFFEGYENCCDFHVINTTSGESKGVAKVIFSDPQHAVFAVEHVNNLEIPGGSIHCTLGECVVPMMGNSPPGGGFYPYMMPGNQFQFYPPPQLYPPYPIPTMENHNDSMRWIRFSCSAKVTPEFVGSRFSQFGMVDILHMDDEKSGTIRFFDHYSAFAARELNGTKINDVVFSVSTISN